MTKQQGKHFLVRPNRQVDDIMREAGMRVLKGTLSLALVASLVPTAPSIARADVPSTDPIVLDRPADGNTDPEDEGSNQNGELETQTEGSGGEDPANGNGTPENNEPETGDTGEDPSEAAAAPVITVKRGDTTVDSGSTKDSTNVAELSVSVELADGATLNETDSKVTVENTPFGSNSSTMQNPTFSDDNTVVITLNEGINVVEIVVKDSNDNESTWTRTIVYDRTAPTVSAGSVSNPSRPVIGTMYPKGCSIDLTFSDNNSDVFAVSDVEITATKDGSPVALTPVMNGNVATVTFTDEGTYTDLIVSAKDSLGNQLENHTVDIADFTVADISLELSETTNANVNKKKDSTYYLSFGNTAEFSLSIPANAVTKEDDLPQTATVTHETNTETPTITWSSRNSEEDPWVGTFTLSQSGRYSDIKVTLSDDAGADPLEFDGNVVIDAAAPTVKEAFVSREPVERAQVEENANVYVYNESTTVTLTVADEYGLSGVSLFTNSTNAFDFNSDGIVEGATEGTVVITIENDGERLDQGALIKITDLAGNYRVWSINSKGQVFIDGEEITDDEELINNTPLTYNLSDPTQVFGSPYALTIDTEAPVISINPADKISGANKAVDGTWYASGRSTIEIPILIKEANFDFTHDLAPNTVIATVTRESDSEVVATLYASDFSGEESEWSGTFSIPASALQDESGNLVSGTYTVSAGFTDIGGNSSNEPSLSFVVDASAPTVSKVTVNNDPSAVGKEDGGNRQFFQAPTSMTIEVSDDFRLSEGTATVQVLNDPDGVYTKPVTISSDGRKGTVTVSLVDGTRCLDENTEFERNVILSLKDVAGNTRTWSIDKNGKVEDANNSSTVNTTINGIEGNYPLALIQDVTAPTTSLSGVSAGTYYNSTQTVHAQIDEFNFGYLQQYDSGRAVMHVTKYEGNSGRAQSRWDIPAFAFTGSGTAWGYNEVFDSDGHYEVEVSFDDFAGNASQVSRIEEFTIDKTAPVVTVEFDNNDVRKEKYYNATRTAIITVVEHNFDPALFTIDAPNGSISGWATNGDTHTCTVTFAEGTGSLDVSGRDLAGNEAAAFTEPEFVIDTQAPSIEIAGIGELLDIEQGTITDQSAYNGIVAPTITYTDVTTDQPTFDEQSYDDWSFTLSGNRGTVVTELGSDIDGITFTSGNYENNSLTVSFDDFSYDVSVDDIYTLHAEMSDLAGNSATADLTFSVNRFGSNYTVTLFDDRGHVIDKTDDSPLTESPNVVIREINVSGLSSEDPTVSYWLEAEDPNYLKRSDGSVDGSAGYYKLEAADETNTENSYGWSEYLYTIDAANFEGDGNYTVEIDSSDVATNRRQLSNYASSDVDRATVDESKKASASFVLDAYGPVIEALSLPEGFAVGEQIASFVVNDEFIKEGTADEVVVKINGEEVAVNQSEGGTTYTFTVPTRSFATNSIEIAVKDWNGRTDEASGKAYVTGLVPEILSAVAVVAAAVGSTVYVRRRKGDEEPEIATRSL